PASRIDELWPPLPASQGEQGHAPSPDRIPEHLQSDVLSSSLDWQPAGADATHESVPQRTTRCPGERLRLRQHDRRRGADAWHARRDAAHRPVHRPHSVLTGKTIWELQADGFGNFARLDAPAELLQLGGEFFEEHRKLSGNLLRAAAQNLDPAAL